MKHFTGYGAPMLYDPCDVTTDECESCHRQVDVAEFIETDSRMCWDCVENNGYWCDTEEDD